MAERPETTLDVDFQILSHTAVGLTDVYWVIVPPRVCLALCRDKLPDHPRQPRAFFNLALPWMYYQVWVNQRGGGRGTHGCGIYYVRCAAEPVPVEDRQLICPPLPNLMAPTGEVCAHTVHTRQRDPILQATDAINGFWMEDFAFDSMGVLRMNRAWQQLATHFMLDPEWPLPVLAAWEAHLDTASLCDIIFPRQE